MGGRKFIYLPNVNKCIEVKSTWTLKNKKK